MQAKDTKTVEGKGRYAPGSRKGAGGRPRRELTEDELLLICAEMAGGSSLTKCLREHPALPSRKIIMREVLEIPEYAARYARARDALLECWADDIIDISDDGTTDYITKVGRNGHEYEAVDQEHIQRSRLRVDSRKWLLSKLKPETYGDKIEASVSGAVAHLHADITSLPEREKARRMALFFIEDQRANKPATHATIEQPASDGQPVTKLQLDDEQPDATRPIDKE